MIVRIIGSFLFFVVKNELYVQVLDWSRLPTILLGIYCLYSARVERDKAARGLDCDIDSLTCLLLFGHIKCLLICMADWVFGKCDSFVDAAT